MTESTADPTMVEQFWNSINREAQEAGRGLFSEVFPAVADAWDGERLHIRREYADANDGVAYPVLSGGQPPKLGKRVWCARVGDGAVVLGRVSEAADETISDLRQAIFDNDTDIAVLQQDKYNKTGGDVTGPVRVKTPANHVQMFDSDSGAQEDRWIIENRDQELRVYWFDNSTETAFIALTISPLGITVFNQKLTAKALESDGPMDILGKINGGGRRTEFGGEIRTGGNIDAQNNTVFANTFNAANDIILGDTINPAGADAKFGGRVVAGGSVVAGGNVLADGGTLVGDGLNVRSGNVGLPNYSIDADILGTSAATKRVINSNLFNPAWDEVGLRTIASLLGGTVNSVASGNHSHGSGNSMDFDYLPAEHKERVFSSREKARDYRKRLADGEMLSQEETMDALHQALYLSATGVMVETDAPDLTAEERHEKYQKGEEFDEFFEFRRQEQIDKEKERLARSAAMGKGSSASAVEHEKKQRLHAPHLKNYARPHPDAT